MFYDLMCLCDLAVRQVLQLDKFKLQGIGEVNTFLVRFRNNNHRMSVLFCFLKIWISGAQGHQKKSCRAM